MILGGQVGGAQYAAAIGDKIRLLWKYDGGFRPFFWFSLGNDGSIYLGPRYEKPGEVRRSVQTAVDAQVHFSYGEGEVLGQEGQKLVSKLSAHASGYIQSPVDPDFRAVRPTFRGLEDQTELCIGVFEHPSLFKPVQAFRKKDVPIEYPFMEEMPVWLHLHVAPLGQAKLVKPKTAIDHVNLLFNCSVFDGGTPDLTVQVTLCHGVEGPWPKASYLVFRADGDKNDAKSV